MSTVSSLATHRTTGTTTRSKPLRAALLITMVLFTAGLLTGFFSLSDLSGLEGATPGESAQWSFWIILTRNLGAATLMYSGVVTFGLTTLVTLPLLGLYVGATMRIGVEAVGWATLTGAVGLYAPFEFAGVLVAAAGGLYPALDVLSRRRGDSGRARAYVRTMPRSLALLGIGVALILVGAALEMLLIHQS